MNHYKPFLNLSLIVAASILFSACGAKKTSNNTTVAPTTTTKEFSLSVGERPYVSLIPRTDGHQLKMVLDRIPTSVKKIEYEVIYTAVDQGNEIEKGLGDTLTIDSHKIEKDLLLGTESCTNGCKYKYDEGVTGGTISLTLINEQGQVTTYQSPFILATYSAATKSVKLSLEAENFGINAVPTNKKEFFVVLKNYGVPAGSTATTAYSVFASDTGKGKISDTAPGNVVSPQNGTISGDYLIN